MWISWDIGKLSHCIHSNFGKEERIKRSHIAVITDFPQLFDFCITFDSEVRWIWGRKWDIMRVAFVVSRYLPVGTVAMYLYSMNALGAVAADVMLVARVHAFCGGEKRAFIAMSFFSVVMITATLMILYIAAKSKCDAPEGNLFIGILYALPMIYQLVLMSLTVYKRFKFYRQENTPLVSTVYWDGVIYMLCIALASMVNCVGIIKLPVNPIMVDLLFDSESDKPAGSHAQRFCFTHHVQSTSNKRIARCLYNWASYLERDHCSTDPNIILCGSSRAVGYYGLLTYFQLKL
ncbi:hypothetical protein BD769DRAFT_1394687 [Suillus cothurnatus]|nr:hypothetical protein BD769DRAFT_1394687 [Suillus cothurnatus]